LKVVKVLILLSFCLRSPKLEG